MAKNENIRPIIGRIFLEKIGYLFVLNKIYSHINSRTVKERLQGQALEPTLLADQQKNIGEFWRNFASRFEEVI